MIPPMYDSTKHAPGMCSPELDKPFLRDWINERGPYARRWDVRYAVEPKQPWFHGFAADSDPVGPSFDVEIVTRNKCAGPAPYVGRPFCYWWWVGFDRVGHSIAADETHLVYTVDEWEWHIRGGEA